MNIDINRRTIPEPYEDLLWQIQVLRVLGDDCPSRAVFCGGRTPNTDDMVYAAVSRDPAFSIVGEAPNGDIGYWVVPTQNEAEFVAEQEKASNIGPVAWQQFAADALGYYVPKTAMEGFLSVSWRVLTPSGCVAHDEVVPVMEDVRLIKDHFSTWLKAVADTVAANRLAGAPDLRYAVRATSTPLATTLLDRVARLYQEPKLLRENYDLAFLAMSLAVAKEAS